MVTVYEHRRATIQYWVGARLEYDLAEIDDGSYAVKENSGAFADYNGVYIWQMERRTIVSVPDMTLYPVVARAMDRKLLAGAPLSALVDEGFWRATLGDRVERIIGPTYQGFLDWEAFTPATNPKRGARQLTLTDHHALRAFIAACPPNDWQDSAISTRHLPLYGMLRAGELIAVASAPRERPRKAVIRSVGVVTAPAWRGKGAGLAIVSALAKHCLDSDTVLRYQTLRANMPSLAIAQRLGFEDVATSLAVRLRA